MRSQAVRLGQGLRGFQAVLHNQKTPGQSRCIHIQKTPSSLAPTSGTAAADASPLTTPSLSVSPDARFEVIGSSSSLLSIALSASQNLYTRRGTLVGLSGAPENAISTLSVLPPLTRGALGIPFLYQKIASTSPCSLLVAPKSANTTLAVLQLDGRLDWVVAQRAGLLAWTGHSLVVKPRVNSRASLAQMGQSTLTGRGLVALSGAGQIYQLTLKDGEHYVAHPGNILAYTTNIKHPKPYRFKSNAFRLQIPSFGAWLPDTQFLRNMRATSTYRAVASALLTLRTWTRSSLRGDRLFLSFDGPATLLLQSRGSRLRDVLTAEEINEVADAPAGAVQVATSTDGLGKSSSTVAQPVQTPARTSMTMASVKPDGKVEFEKQ